MQLAGKGIVVVAGAGRSGRAAVAFLEQKGLSPLLLDDASKDPQKYGLMAMCHLRQPIDVVVLSPGISRKHPAIVWALEKGISVINEIELAAVDLPNCHFVGVTGTNGKSTTTTLLGSILAQRHCATFVGGNLGRPLCETLLAGENPQYAVLELSSFQLETLAQSHEKEGSPSPYSFQALGLSLEAAIITNLSPDHLDRYETVEDYYQAKYRIFELLEKDGTAIWNASSVKTPSMQRTLYPFNVERGRSGICIEGNKLYLCRDGKEIEIVLQNPHLIGQHNAENAAAACAAALALGFSEVEIQAGLYSYEGIAHRLEHIGEHNGVVWINDSKATNIVSAMTALRVFDKGVHLILGGKGKGSSYAPLIEMGQNRVKCVYAIGEDEPAIVSACEGLLPVKLAHTLEKAVELAASSAQAGDIILLAPACASYDQFKDYAHRGDAFRELFMKTVG